jgi:hypothetical protein
MRLCLLYADLTLWTGEAEEVSAAPEKGVLRLSAEHPEGCELHFSGWDHYGVDAGAHSVLIGVWKTDDPEDPYYRRGMVWSLGPNGAQSRTPYLGIDEFPAFPVSRRGQWVSDDVAREVGLL